MGWSRNWKDIPKKEMFIWGYREHGKLQVGLAYWTVSGSWRDAYGNNLCFKATHWHPMPEPPEA